MADNRKESTSGGGVVFKVDVENFLQRLMRFHSHWRENKAGLWGSADALVIATPPSFIDHLYQKSSALSWWLLGLVFPDTIMVFLDKQIHFLCSQKRASLLDVLKTPTKENIGAEIVMHVKAKGDNGMASMDEIFRAVRTQTKSNGQESPIIGYIADEVPEGNLSKTWVEKLKSSTFNLTDATNGFADLLAVKDKAELKNVKLAASLTSFVMKHFVVPMIESVIDEEKEVSHDKLMKDTVKAIQEPDNVKVKLAMDKIEVCYRPIFQSGGKFDLRYTASSTVKNLYYEPPSVIIFAFGCRYNGYCSNVARTLLFDPNAIQSKAYGVLLKAHEAAIASLKPGNTVSAVYNAASLVVERDGPEFSANLTESAGAGIGIEFHESSLTLNSKNNTVVKAGMVFNVSLGFQDLRAQTNNPKTGKFSLLLADTVIVNENSTKVLTPIRSKNVKKVAYHFIYVSEESEEQLEVKEVLNDTKPILSKVTRRSDNQEMSKEEFRTQHQAELTHQKNKETARRLVGGGSRYGHSRGVVKPSDLIAYKNVNDIPKSTDLIIQIDQKNEAILLPIYGSMIPFHVATVKSVYSHQQEGARTCYIRIIFNVPGTSFTPDANSLEFQGSIYLKEVSFRSKDVKHISEVVRMIKTLRHQVLSREVERAERATLASQEKLHLTGNKVKTVRLPNLWIRPSGWRRGKSTGTLEAHVNGFRYTSKPDQYVEVMYANIKHAFFQPAKKEMSTLLHFHLHNHIMVGNKKTKDVQFYVEVMDKVQSTLMKSAHDPDEIEEEQQERDRKNRINLDFEDFVNKVNEIWRQPLFSALGLEFDQPFRELGFDGVPYKSRVFVIPTSSCLVELVETPFLVITLNEIEIVSLERVEFGRKTFDMVIVFKDLKRNVVHIDAIASTSLNPIKKWLNIADLKYYENKLNIKWGKTLKTIADDPEQFLQNGEWEFLNMDASDSDSGNTEDLDEEYEPTDVESNSEDEDDDSESLVETDDDDEEDSD